MKYDIDIDRLRTLYLEGHTTREISSITGVPARTICRYLKASGVQLRNPGHPTIAALADKAWLEQQYAKERKSTPQIASEVGCSARIVSHWLARHGIPARSTGSELGHDRNTEDVRRKMSLAKRGTFIGDKNPNWKGGITSRDLDRSRYRAKAWVKAVKDRDGWRCVECGSDDDLHAHHVKSWRRHPTLRYDIDNGTTLCNVCHQAAHGFVFPRHAKTPTSASHPSGEDIVSA